MCIYIVCMYICLFVCMCASLQIVTYLIYIYIYKRNALCFSA